jgi:Tfp pilus assembly protein PilV
MAPAWPRTPPAEAGFALIEVLISATMVVLVSAGVLGLLQAMTSSAAGQRDRTAAFSVAQEDQARLRAMKLSTLNGLTETSDPITLNGTVFTVESKGVFVNDLTSTPSCTEEKTSTADYVQIISRVTWTDMRGAKPVEIESIISPSRSLSLNPNHGTLVVSAENAQAKPLPGLKLEATGPSPSTTTYSGETDEHGCATFADKEYGTYSVLPSGPNFVDVNGKPPVAQNATISKQGTYRMGLQYDKEGSVQLSFQTLVAGKLEPATADAVFLFNAGMTNGAKVAWTTSGKRESKLSVAALFPFDSSYVIYAGSCSKNNPDPTEKMTPPGGGAIAYVDVPAGNVANGGLPVPIKLPALDLTVKNNGVAVKGAKVTITDLNCKEAKGLNLIKREYTTNAEGKQVSTTGVPVPPATELKPEPGLPFSTYKVCVSIKKTSSVYFRREAASVAVQDPAVPTPLTLDLKGFESGSPCP